MDTSYTLCTNAQAKCFARAFWQTQGTPLYQAETILPKGVVEIIFSFDEPVPFSRNSQVKHLSTPRCFVSGMSDTPVQLDIPERQAFFGMELHPAAIKKLLKVPCGDFLNAITDLEGINKEFSSLWHQLAEAVSFHSRVSITQEWLGKKLCSIPEQELAISDFLKSDPGSANVAGLATQFCYSVRQLHRKTRELFGMSTEGLIRYQRYVHALQLMHHSQETLTRIGYDCRYYDQAHFIREFKDFTGLTPGDYRQQKSKLPGHLYNNVRYVQ
jgi:AraC-like DNA-binding protein